SSLQILLATVGVDESASAVHGHGTDGQVPPLQVLLQGNVGRGMEGETAIAATAFALSAGQRVLCAGLWIRTERKVLANRAKPGRDHLFGRGADHDPVMFMPGHAQQLIADRAADQVSSEICFHGATLSHCARQAKTPLPAASLRGLRGPPPTGWLR